MYSLLIKRYSSYEKFDTLEELKAEVSRYFTQSEKAIVERLTTFNSFVGGVAKNEHQDFTTMCCQ